MLTQEQVDNVEEKPEDSITLEGETYSGTVYHYILEGKQLVLQTLNISTKKSETLSPFLYTKPDDNDGSNISNTVETEEIKPRVGFYPLAIVKKAYRGPNHWHREDDSVYCAVEIDGEWKTRYFPKKNIPNTTWEEAIKIIAENK